MRSRTIVFTALLLAAPALCMPGVSFAQQQEAHKADQALEVVSIDSKLVTEKPYFADSTAEVVQTLSDGNRIVRNTVSKFYRDSAGRTRREQTFGNVDPSNPGPHEVKIFIDDPVNKVAYVLDPGEKTALQVRRSPEFIYTRASADVPREQKLPPLDEAHNITRQDLGSKTIEGILCKGTEQTITIPAGQIGNERPISIVTDTWYAPSIDAVVQSSTNDPRFGVTTYQLHNVRLGEQAPALFAVPPSYRLVHSQN